MLRPSVLLYVALFGAGVVAVRPVDAQSQRSDALIQLGRDARRRGQDDVALDLFRRAWTQDHLPEARAQMALAEQALGDWVDADAYLREAMEATTDHWVTENRAVLDESLRTIETHLGQIEVRGGVPGAEVLLNGNAIATLPMAVPVRAPVGHFPMQVRAAGHRSVTLDVDVRPGELTRESVELVPVAAAPVVAAPVAVTPLATPTPTMARPTSSAASHATVATSPRTAPAPITHEGDSTASQGSSLQHTLGITGLIAGGVLAVGGVIATVVRNSNANSFNGALCNVQDPNPSSTCSGYQSTVNTTGALAVASYVGGGVLAGLGAVLLLTAPSHRRESASATQRGWTVVGGPGQVGLGLRANY